MGAPPAGVKPLRKAFAKALPARPAFFAAALAAAPKPIAAPRLLVDNVPSSSNGCSAPSDERPLDLIAFSQHLCLAVPRAAQFLALAGPFLLFTSSLQSLAIFHRKSSSDTVTIACSSPAVLA